jgi:hypothetical protein
MKVVHQGKEKEAVEVDFKTIKEDWNEYNLDDGTRIKIKPVALNFVRVMNEFDSEGNPVYLVKASNVISVSAPDALRRMIGGKTEVH